VRSHSGPGTPLLLVIVYYHGDALVVGSTVHRPTHLYLNGLAADGNVLIVSPEYHLAQEHPLPAAHDDSSEGFEWVASHATAVGEKGAAAKLWISKHEDLSRVFVAGVTARAATSCTTWPRTTGSSQACWWSTRASTGKRPSARRRQRQRKGGQV
jgi:hypothetical protein